MIQASVAWQEVYMYSLKPEFISVLYLNDHAREWPTATYKQQN